eukprot:5660662-Pyramimonas_sp.AAC.1
MRQDTREDARPCCDHANGHAGKEKESDYFKHTTKAHLTWQGRPITHHLQVLGSGGGRTMREEVSSGGRRCRSSRLRGFVVVVIV